ncbi:MAG: MotA/TolQ/ExbB proton channel family protein [Muribaculaceae bacterium]|nr:MotA/TolQ/ExbB proton channel family protein [Muribaculaceae bacterium]
MNVISNVLYWISTGLLVPVIVLLIFFFIRALVLVGAFFGQYMHQRKASDALRRAVDGIAESGTAASDNALPAASASVAAAYARRIVAAAGQPARIDLLLSEFELDADKNVSTSRVLTKMGPILGLMGTLIPMGPALVGLAAGDIASMAYNMQVAFATTVVGLVVSAIGFLTQQAKERWAVRDLATLEFLAETVKQKGAL